MKINTINTIPFVARKSKTLKKNNSTEPTNSNYIDYLRPKNSQKEVEAISEIRKNLKNKITADRLEQYYTLFYLMDEIAKVNGAINPDILDMESFIILHYGKLEAQKRHDDKILFDDCLKPIQSLLSLKIRGEDFVNFVMLSGNVNDLCEILKNPNEHKDEIKKIKEKLDFIKSKKALITKK